MSSKSQNGVSLNGTNGTNGSHDTGKASCWRTEFSNPDPGPFSIPETPVRGHVIRVDRDGFGIVEFEHDIGAAQLGYFTSKTELVNGQAKKVQLGATVNGLIEAVEMQIPERAGPLTLPLKRLELIY
jgi:hypothetical protein